MLDAKIFRIEPTESLPTLKGNEPVNMFCIGMATKAVTIANTANKEARTYKVRVS
jgi:hypothetical protein